MSTRPKRSGTEGNSFNMWVSTNKVLIGSVGGPKKPHCRNPNFDCEETKLLVSLWGDPQVQKTLVTTHKKHPVIAKLADKMREYGYNRSTEEINTRIKNLKCFYNRIKKDLETGVINETSWKHFQAMDDIMTRPIFGNHQSASNQDSEAGPSSTSSKKSSDDQVEVKLELIPDEDKEITPEDLLKNAEQVELKEPNLLIPKDEPMDQDNDDDPNDPDFENDGDDEEESIDEDSDESDFDINDERRRARLRRRASRKVSRTTKTTTVASTASTTVTSLVPALAVAKQTTPTATVSTTATIQNAPGQIKFINYAGKQGINISTIVSNPNVISASSAQNVAIVSATPTTSTTNTSGKISLVPTNFLLKPQAPNVNFNSPIQLYTKPTVSMATSIATSSTVVSSASGVQPMKLLLVNAGTSKQQLIAPAAPKQIYTTTPTPVVRTTPATPITIQPKPVLTTTTNLMTVSQKKPETSVPLTITPVAPKQAGFKALLGQLVSLQRESLALSRSRMNVERERLNNEKHVACSLVEALNDLNNLLQSYSGTVNVGDDFGSAQQTFQFPASDAAKELRGNDTSQDTPPVTNLIPVVDTIKAEVISDSD